ncbi:MAG: uroporphyrinogen-III C-methyltransferase [Deltaproteobacteria bacterium]|nr:uroporphyrinogen-III C-methyltransferase [Deltaproteobacteria bacterium]
MKAGTVYLVGAGPGDVGLITLRGAQVLGRADVIVYDYLANERLLKLAKPTAKKIFAGKKGGGQSIPQPEIEKILIEEAQAGNLVVRLKGGDPFIFGRGGEEALALARAKVPFEVIPGVSSATAVPAYAGIPLTHRDFSSEVAFVTGHEDPRKGEESEEEITEKLSAVPWEALAKMGTIVILMGKGHLRANLSRLISYGKSPDTPAAVVSWGTYPQQKTIVATLSTLADETEKRGVTNPTIVIIGEVVRLKEMVDWFETKVLFNKTILVTRTQEQSSEITALLEEAGGVVLEFPTIQLVPMKNYSALDGAIRKIKKQDWLIFTSANGVRYFWDRLRNLGKDVRWLAKLKVGAIGPATAAALREKGIWVDLLPQTFQSEGMLEALKESDIRGKRVLLPRAKEGREVLIEGLQKLKCKVEVVETYGNVIPEVASWELEKLFFETKPDWVTFASSSSVDNFVKILGKKNLKTYLARVKIACIGPVTAASAKKAGMKVDAMPEESTISKLVEAIILSVSPDSPKYP